MRIRCDHHVLQLVIYTGINGFTGMLNGRWDLLVRKVPKFPEGKERLINMADTREIEYTLVSNARGKLDLCKHVNLRKRSCQTCERHLKDVNA